MIAPADKQPDTLVAEAGLIERNADLFGCGKGPSQDVVPTPPAR